MVYKYCENMNFEDLASGRVIAHKAGYPNFPVRLAQEIFGRCLSYLDCTEDICIYDPCCGGGYLLTVLGFLNYKNIKTIMASDISEEALQLAGENLSLLHREGLEGRISQLKNLYSLHNKESHAEALGSAANLLSIVTDQPREIEYEVFKADILSACPLVGCRFKADIIFADVPYGRLVEWQDRSGENGNVQNGNEDRGNGKERSGSSNFLDQLIPVMKDNSIVAICSDKSQKFQSGHFQRLEKQAIGKRVFQIFKLS